MTSPAQPVRAIEADNVRKTYPGGVRALDGLSFGVEHGTVFGLLGPNGAGKSTTIKILTTLARPDSGSVRVAGHDALRHPDRVRRAIGVVSQRSGADPMTTGRDNLILQGRLYGLRGAALRDRVEALLGRFDLVRAAGREVRTYWAVCSAGWTSRSAWCTPPGAVPRRADDRAGSRVAGRDVGRDRTARQRSRADHPADHPPPGGDRPARPPAGHRRPGADRRHGHAGGAEGRAAR